MAPTKISFTMSKNMYPHLKSPEVKYISKVTENYLPGPPTMSSRYHKNVDPFSYGTTENASSGSTPSKLTTNDVRGLFSP